MQVINWGGSAISSQIGIVPALDSAAQTVGAAIAKLADDNDGADFDASTDSLQEIRDNGDANWGAAAVSGGARTITLTVDDGTTALEGAKVRVTEGLNSFELATNASGVVVFALDDATWTVAITKPLFTFTNTTLVVSADAAQTYSMTAIAVPASNPGRVTGFIYTYDEDGVIEVGATVSLQAAKFPGKGLSLDTAIRTETSDGNGLVTFTNLFAGTTYRIRRGSDRDWVTAKLPTTATGTIELENVLGADD